MAWRTHNQDRGLHLDEASRARVLVDGRDGIRSVLGDAGLAGRVEESRGERGRVNCESPGCRASLMGNGGAACLEYFGGSSYPTTKLFCQVVRGGRPAQRRTLFPLYITPGSTCNSGVQRSVQAAIAPWVTSLSAFMYLGFRESPSGVILVCMLCERGRTVIVSMRLTCSARSLHL